MAKKDFREQVKEVAGLVADRSPHWITSQQIQFMMNCGATKAQNLCKALDTLSDLFEYQNGDIQYTGKPDEWKEDLKHEG